MRSASCYLGQDAHNDQILYTGGANSHLLPVRHIHDMSSIEIIHQFLQDRLDQSPASITPEMTLEELGVDSLMLLELMFEFEEKLNIKLPSDVTTPKTVGELLTLVESLENQPGS